MKKLNTKVFTRMILLAMAVLVATALLLAQTAYAEMADPAPTVPPYTWAALLTTAGCTAAVLMVVQYLKVPLDRVWKIPTRVFVLILSFVFMLAAKAFTSGVALGDVPLLALNAFVVALAAMGAYENTFGRQSDEK